MSTIVEELKLRMGYAVTQDRKCETCFFCELDNSTDSFGPGDQCTRNPDVPFIIERTASCSKWTRRVRR